MLCEMTFKLSLFTLLSPKWIFTLEQPARGLAVYVSFSFIIFLSFLTESLGVIFAQRGWTPIRYLPRHSSPRSGAPPRYNTGCWSGNRAAGGEGLVSVCARIKERPPVNSKEYCSKGKRVFSSRGE